MTPPSKLSAHLSNAPAQTEQNAGVSRGKLIVIEGTDGSGKTVQTHLLVERLLRAGYQVQMTDFPQYGKSFFAKMIEKYLKGEFGWPQALRDHLKVHPFSTKKSSTPDNKGGGIESMPDEVSPYLTSLLYAGDRWEARNQMHKWLDEGNIIISNRYVCSNMAHQGAKIRNIGERKKFFAWIEELEYNVYDIPRTNLIIYLHVPVEISQGLINIKVKEARGFKSKVDLHEKDTEYLRRVQDTYKDLADSNNDWFTIECTENNQMKPKGVIAEDVWKTVSKILD